MVISADEPVHHEEAGIAVIGAMHLPTSCLTFELVPEVADGASPKLERQRSQPVVELRKESSLPSDPVKDGRTIGHPGRPASILDGQGAARVIIVAVVIAAVVIQGVRDAPPQRPAHAAHVGEPRPLRGRRVQKKDVPGTVSREDLLHDARGPP